MPTDASGTIQATSQCITSNSFNGANLVSSTQICYRSQDVYGSILIEGLFFAGVIAICLVLAKIMKN